MGKKSKKRRAALLVQKGISRNVQRFTAEVEYVLRCTFVPMENRTPEGIARLGEAVYRDKIA